MSDPSLAITTPERLMEAINAVLTRAAPQLFPDAREMALLRERIAELEATIANERGEGDPPVPGWTWTLEGEIADPCWHREGAVVYMERDYDGTGPGHSWLWWAPGMRHCERAKTAREGMQAARCCRSPPALRRCSRQNRGRWQRFPCGRQKSRPAC